MTDLYRYAAFISYSSRDTAFAQRLHKTLEAYRVPRKLGAFDLIGGGGKSNRVFPIFRDREELPSGNLGDAIEAALRASAALIVVCSPNAAQSAWVEKEIAYFESLGRGHRIFAVIATGEPAESFPPSFDNNARRAAGRPALELLAGDARPNKDGWRNAWLKIVAGLLGVNLGTLVDRDRQAQRQRLVYWSVGAMAILVVLVLPLTLELRRQGAEARASLLASAEASISAGELDSAALALASLPKGWWMPPPPKPEFADWSIDPEEALRLSILQSSSIVGDLTAERAMEKVESCGPRSATEAVFQACNLRTKHRLSWEFEAGGTKFLSWPIGSKTGKLARLVGPLEEELRRALTAGSGARLTNGWDGLSISDDGNVGLAIASAYDPDDWQRKVFPGALILLDFSGRGPPIRWIIAPEGVYAAALAPDGKTAVALTTRNTYDDNTTRSRLLLVDIEKGAIVGEKPLGPDFTVVRPNAFSSPLPEGGVQITSDGRIAIAKGPSSTVFYRMPDLEPIEPPPGLENQSPAAFADPRFPRVALLYNDRARIWRSDLNAIETEFDYRDLKGGPAESGPPGWGAAPEPSPEAAEFEALFSVDGASVAFTGPWGAARESLPPLTDESTRGFGPPARIRREIEGGWALANDGSGVIVSTGGKLVELRFRPTDTTVQPVQAGLEPLVLDPKTPRNVLVRDRTPPVSLESGFDIEQAILSAQGNAIALRAANGRVEVRDLSRSEIVGRIQLRDAETLSHLSEDGARLVVEQPPERSNRPFATSHRRLRILDPVRNVEVSILAETQTVSSTLLPNGQALLVTQNDVYARWDLTTGSLSPLALVPVFGRGVRASDHGILVFQDSAGPHIVDIERQTLISKTPTRDVRWIETAKAMLVLQDNSFCHPNCTLSLQRTNGEIVQLQNSSGAALGSWTSAAHGEVVAAPSVHGDVGFWSSSTGNLLSRSPRIVPPALFDEWTDSNAAFSPDGRALFVWRGGAVWALDPSSGTVIRRAAYKDRIDRVDAVGQIWLDGRPMLLESLPKSVPADTELCSRYTLAGRKSISQARRGLMAWIVPIFPCGAAQREEPGIMER